jgi:hypothetical protein
MVIISAFQIATVSSVVARETRRMRPIPLATVELQRQAAITQQSHSHQSAINQPSISHQSAIAQQSHSNRTAIA